MFSLVKADISLQPEGLEYKLYAHSQKHVISLVHSEKGLGICSLFGPDEQRIGAKLRSKK